LQVDGRGRAAVLIGWASMVMEVIGWVKHLCPLDFGYVRSRWCCATLALVLLDVHRVKVSRETIRRWLRSRNLVWRRPRPVLLPRDPNKRRKMRKIRALLANLPADEIALFQDEVDINTNPDIGSMWMEKGKQAKVLTPGTNTKRYLAGSMNWRTGRLIVTEGSRRNADLFLAHLDELRRTFCCYRKIHVICDNARFHTIKGSKKVAAYLAQWSDRIVLHYLPKYAPETNPIERVWWHLHEQITRNHRCGSIEELVELVLRWIEEKESFKIEGHVYELLKAA
jgi:transposase